MKKIFSSLLFALVFLLVPNHSVFAGSGNLRIAIQDQTTSQPSYVTFASVTGPTASGGVQGIIDCNSKDIISAVQTCVDYIKSNTDKRQIIIVSVRNVIPGAYTITSSRSGYQVPSSSFAVAMENENGQTDGTLDISPTGTAGIPHIEDPGTLPRGSSTSIQVSGLNELSFLSHRYTLELVDQFGNKFDCQELRGNSANIRTPSDNSISNVSLRVYQTNTRDTGIPACQDIAGQSPLDSRSATLTAAPGGAEVLYKYDKGTNSCNPDPSGEPLAECEKKITVEKKHEPFEPIRCGGGISTALGCIPIGDPSAFAGWFLRLALGISGGIAFLLMIFAGFQIMTSAGNPDKIQGGKELLNAAISGLILIVFSIFLLKLIGVDILGLPGFGS